MLFISKEKRVMRRMKAILIGIVSMIVLSGAYLVYANENALEPLGRGAD